MVELVECCFTSTETVGLLGTGAQDGHLDFHTAPELCVVDAYVRHQEEEEEEEEDFTDEAETALSLLKGDEAEAALPLMKGDEAEAALSLLKGDEAESALSLQIVTKQRLHCLCRL